MCLTLIAGEGCWEGHGRSTERADKWGQWCGGSARLPRKLWGLVCTAQAKGRDDRKWPEVALKEVQNSDKKKMWLLGDGLG